MSDTAEAYDLDGITVQAKPQRFRTARRGRAGYEPGSADAIASAIVNTAWDDENSKIEAELREAEAAEAAQGESEGEVKRDPKLSSTMTRPTSGPSPNPVMIRTGNTMREKKFECTYPPVLAF